MSIKEKLYYYKQYGIMFTDGDFQYRIETKNQMLIRLFKQL